MWGVNLKKGELISGSLRYGIYHLVPFAVSSKEAFFGTTEDKKLFYWKKGLAVEVYQRTLTFQDNLYHITTNTYIFFFLNHFLLYLRYYMYNLKW